MSEMNGLGGAVHAVDVAAERSRTLGSRKGHYFNAAGAALQSDAVLEAMIGHLREEQVVGGYEAATAATDRLEQAYRDAAALLGAHSDEIAFFDSATTGLRTVFDALRLGAGHTVIASRSSYVSQALRLLAMREKDGVKLVVLPNGADGSVDLDALSEAVAAAGTRAVVSAVHVPTSSGLVEPVNEIGAITRRHGACYVLDATQSIGQLDADVHDIGCDVLVTTGRKFLRGPRGTGFAYVSRELLARIQPWAPDVRGSVWTAEQEWTHADSARMLESWEFAVAARLGLAVALREVVDRGMRATEEYLVGMASDLRERLRAVDGVTITDPPRSPSAIVTFRVDGVPERDVVAGLTLAGVKGIVVPAHHAQWDLGARGLSSVVRVSPHVYNDAGDAAALVAAVESAARTQTSSGGTR